MLEVISVREQGGISRWAGSVSVKLINGWVNRFRWVGLVNAIEFLVGWEGMEV